MNPNSRMDRRARVPQKRSGRRGAPLSRRQKQTVKRLIGLNAETDYYDNGLNASAVGVVSTIQGGLSTPIQGVADGQRVGDKLKAKLFNFRFNLIFGDPTQVVRVILFRWYEDNTVAPTAAQILQNPLGFPVTTGINHDTIKKGQLHVMFDKTYSMSGTGSSASIFRSIKIYGRKLGKKGIEFNNGAITGVNHIYALFQSDSTAAPNPVINWYSRLEYTDA